MKKFVIVSSNGNPDYEWYLPLVKWAWNKIGWGVIVMRPFKSDFYREETITQCMRLYAAHLPGINPDDILMTSDADMIPLSDYWHPEPGKITIYGHDLTGYNHVPICYIAMQARAWISIMNLKESIQSDLLRDLALTSALSEIKYGAGGWWGVDQDMITERLQPTTSQKINRGIEPGSNYPTGRVDRSNINFYPSTLIDFHAPREPWKHNDKIREVIVKAYGECPAL